MASLQIESPPAAEPVTLEETKSFLRVTITDDDDLISGLITAAREVAEVFCSRSFVNKGYRQSLDWFPYYSETYLSQQAYPPSYYSLPRYTSTPINYSQMIKLFRGPLQKVSRISYLSSGDGQWHNLTPALENWQRNTLYTVGDQIEDSNGHMQEVTATTGDSLSGSSEPTWATPITADNHVTWTDRGVAPAAGFIYDRDAEPPRLFPLPGQSWPPVLYVPPAVQLHYTAGYGADGTNVPAAVKTAIKSLCAGWYENREPASPVPLHEIPQHVQVLLWTHRVVDCAPTRG